ncbi:probable basic-leucine zipper transcription factor R [Drosophila rhopaloa]|uniref:Myb/SANT-like DNA-binding domain-containing protein n=1 Tax=Drosophila rhopaloa TaxID=1041015 RepID=A0ABM5GZ33_DRORH|nr:probable basic-leucine zipper transcription factor R [Drosophila rhopaloa]
MDYEKVALNAGGSGGSTAGGGSGSGAEQDPAMCGGQEMLEGRAKEKARRYWTPSEEERLYEIWGRDNWRLTRTGKNTIFFGRWAEELRERFAVDVKPEEIQMKVNQTRAKFRQVKKQLQADPSSYATRWKKYDIINRILKNLHRPKNADPLPPEALLNNRDMTPPREEASAEQVQQPLQQQGLGLAAEPPATTFYNSNSNHGSSHNNNNSGGMSFSTELFTDQYDEVVKQEYEDDEYRSLPFQEQLQQYSPAEPAQLLELQTPQQQQQQFQQSYEPQFQQQPAHFTNNTGNSVAATSTINHQPITAVAYINSSNNTISVATNANGGMSAQGSVQAPAPALAPTPAVAPAPATNPAIVGASPVPVPRKRGRPYGSVNPPHADSLEALYMEEVRRKNQLLYEQTKISRQRLELEERKVDLMQTFFPKCLEQQAQILSHVMQLQQQEPTHQQHPLPTAQRPQ